MVFICTAPYLRNKNYVQRHVKVQNRLYLYYNSLKSVCRSQQTASRNSCLIVSGDVSNCSYRLKAHPVTSSRLSSA